MAVYTEVSDQELATFLRDYDIGRAVSFKGITEGVEQCLVRDVEKNDMSRLMWLIDEGGKTLEACTYPLAQAFLIIEGNPKSQLDYRTKILTELNKKAK